MIRNEKELVSKSTCDELCVLANKKEFDVKLKNNKIKKLANNELQKNFCPPCE